MTSVDRLLQFIDKQGISKRAFYLAIGVSNGYLDKTKSVNSDVMAEILYKYPDLNMVWLITGNGEMLISDKKYTVTPDDKHHLVDPEVTYQTNTPVVIEGVKTKKGQKDVHPTVHPTRILTPQFITVDRHGRENIIHVPVRARAGYLTGYGDPEFIESLQSYTLPGLNSGKYRSFEVDGDSMHPTLKNKEIIIGEWVEKLEYIRDDRVYVLVTKNDGVVIKRCLNRIDKHGLVIAKSDALDNRNLYPNIQVNPEDIQEIWYGVFHGGFDFQSPADTWKRLNNNEADITILQNQVKQLMNLIQTSGLLK